MPDTPGAGEHRGAPSLPLQQAQLDRIERMLVELLQWKHGVDGSPGIDTRLALAEKEQRDLREDMKREFQAIKEAREKASERGWYLTLAVVAGVIVSLAAAGISVVSAVVIRATAAPSVMAGGPTPGTASQR